MLAFLVLTVFAGHSGCSRSQTMVIVSSSWAKLGTESKTYHNLDIILMTNRAVVGAKGNFVIGRVCRSKNVDSHIYRSAF